ncbi:MAG: DUF1415 domain-containing protein [Bacteroidota bacterium]
MANSSEAILKTTRKWLSEIVIGHGLCPFAASVFRSESIAYRIYDGQDIENLLQAFWQLCQDMDQQESIVTSLLIIPNVLADFESYLDVLAMSEQLLIDQDYEGIYQVASFHPNYLFADSPKEDPAHYTNRSPYPMLHLLREESISQVAAHYPDIEQIPFRNLTWAREMGVPMLKALRDACFV